VSFETMTLGEIAARAGGEVRTGPFGSQLHKADYVEDASATPVVMPKDMVDGKIDTSSIARIDHATVERLSAHILRAGDIALGRRGDIGRRAWTGQDEDGWLCGTGSMRLSLNGSLDVRSRFVFYYLALPEAVAWLEGHSVGATMSNLSAGVVEQLPVRFPSLVHQDQVVEILDAMDDLIENNRRRIEILEEMARLLYREWFVHFRFPGHENVELVDSELGPIPEGWDVGRVQDLGSVVTGSTPPKKDPYLYGDQIPFLTPSDMSTARFVRPARALSTKGGERMARRLVPAGSVCFTCIGSIGKVAVASEVTLTNQQVNSVVPHARYGSGFVLQLLLGRTDYIRSIVSGAATPIINKTSFANVKVLLPAAQAVEKYRLAEEPLSKLVQNLESQKQVLREARDLLLPRLVSGELDVSELDLGGVLA